MVEYALILVTILVVAVVGAALVGAASNGNYLDVESCFDSAASC